MTTVLAAYLHRNCIGRCDAKCYDAKGTTCRCACGGRNHGVGHDQALRNAKEDNDNTAKTITALEKVFTRVALQRKTSHSRQNRRT